MTKDELMKMALSLSPLDYPNRDRIQQTLEESVVLQQIAGRLAIVVEARDPHSGFHGMLYPCDEQGAVTDWKRESHYFGNGKTADEALSAVLESSVSAQQCDYPIGAKVEVLSPHEWDGAKGKIETIHAEGSVEAQGGRRYRVGFYDENNNLHGYGNFRQSQLKLIEPETAQGEE